jgi:hypothetical protein
VSGLALIGLPTYALKSVSIGPPEDPARPASRLGDPHPWRRCRFATTDPSLLYVDATLAFPNSGKFRPVGDGVAVSGVAVVNHNLSIGSEWRVRLFGDGSTLQTERVVPLSVESLFGFTGAVTAIRDDPYDPDGFALNNDGSSTSGSALVMLDTPAEDPVGPQQIRVRVEWDADVELTEGGFGIGLTQGMTSVAGWYLPPGAAFPPSPHVFQLNFDASQLADPSGGDCVVSVAFSGSLPDGGASDIGKVRIAAIDWDCRQLVSGLVADSGWMDAVAEEPDATWGSTPPGVLGVPPQQLSAWVNPGGAVEANAVRVEFRDPLNRVGYVDVGCLVVGPAFVPTRDRDWGSLVELVGRDVVVDMDSGGWTGSRRKPRRRMSIPLPWMEPVEEWVSLFERFWRAGMLTPFVIATVATDDVEARHLNLYVRAERLPRVSKTRGFYDQRAVDFEVIEVL